MSQAVVPHRPEWTGMSGLARVPEYVVMQPTTLCNLDCGYCYLPDRVANRRMSPAVSAAVAGVVNTWARDHPGFGVVWHGGEPLATGRDAFTRLLAPFSADVEHQVQTNATLIDDAWCALLREHRVRVSISVDGPQWRNDARRNRAHRPAYDMIMHGVDALHRNELPFSVLCVVSDPQPGQATELYRYFADLGAGALGINIEEHEGINTRATAFAGTAVRAFWAELLAAWRADPRVRVREIEWSLGYAAGVLAGTAADLLPRHIDPTPAIAWDGSVIVLSPELAGFSDPRHGEFSCGNVLDRPLDEIVAAAAGVAWVGEYLAGVEACRTGCRYFGFCGGAHAANRLFENGGFSGTETNHCRNSKMRLLDGVLDHALAAVPDPPAARPAAPGGTAVAPGRLSVQPAGSGGPTGREAVAQVADPAVDPLSARVHRAATGLEPMIGAAGRQPSFYNWHNRPR